MLLFIFCLSCLVFPHFVFPVRLRTVLSLTPVKCFASWVYASSKVNLLCPRAKTRDLFFLEDFLSNPLVFVNEYVPLTTSAAASNVLVSSSTRFRQTD